MKTELKIFNRLLETIPEIKIYKGFGYCGYCSKLLNTELTKHKINSSILLGEYLSDSKNGNICKTNNKKLIESFPDTGNSIYSDIKQYYIKRKNKLPDRTGHAVVLIDDTIYDLTSGQFGIENIYKIDVFKDIWEQTFICDIKIDETKLDTFKIKKVNKLKLIP